MVKISRLSEKHLQSLMELRSSTLRRTEISGLLRLHSYSQVRSSTTDKASVCDITTRTLALEKVKRSNHIKIRACEKNESFFMRPLLMDVIVVILHKKWYSSPYPIECYYEILCSSCTFSVCCDIYKDCVR